MGLFRGMSGRKAYSLHLKANRLMDQKQFQQADQLHKQAMELYQKEIDEGVQNPRNMMAYGVLLMRQHQFEKARELMLKTEKVKGITRDEKRQLRINFAICEWKLGHLDQAIEQMRMAGHDNMTSMIYGSLGYMLIEKARQTGDFTEAVEFNQQALDYDEDDAVVLDNMGQLYLSMGEKGEARAYFQRAHERKPHQVDTLYYLAKLSYEDGETDKARAYLDRAMEGNYSALCTTTREQAKQLLDSLG